MKRSIAGLFAVAMLTACADAEPDSQSSSPDSAGSKTSSMPAGRIVFNSGDVGAQQSLVYTMNPDGSELKKLLPGTGFGGRWAPDGSEISVFCCDDGTAAHFVDVETGDLRTIPQPDPDVGMFCGGAWSPDGERLACAGYGADDPSRNGMYTVRVSDGGGLRRITSNPGGDDSAGAFSPDGKRLVFVRSKNEAPVGIFVVNVDGSGLRSLSPKDMVLDASGFAGRWSPTSNDILIVAHKGESGPKRIWIVNADGGAPRELPITSSCEFGCYSPSWSPDGTKIVFARSDGETETIHIVNPDGTGLVQVSDHEGDNPDWGTPPQS